MNRRDLLAATCSTAPFLLSSIGNSQCKSSLAPGLGSSEERESLKQTGDAIRAAFARGDVPGILAYHHPDVIKALSYQNYLVGIEALRENLLRTLQALHLEFVENTPETTVFQDGTAIEESLFTIRATPKTGGASSLIKGRSMVVIPPARPAGPRSGRSCSQPPDRPSTPAQRASDDHLPSNSNIVQHSV